MLLNKEKRIKYLGFDDLRFAIIGIFVLSFIITYLFNSNLSRMSLHDAVFTWIVSLFFTICNWLTLRRMMIWMRHKYPSFSDNIKRNLLVFLLMLFSVIIIDELGNIILSRFLGNDYHRMSWANLLLPIFIISTMILAIYEAVYFYTRLEVFVRHDEQAKQMITQAKLDALRNQAQPHFLFNSLNTLRDIIDQDPKEDAKKFVDKLSDVYRFILDSGKANLVPLRDELKFAKAYIHIQSERFGDNLTLNWNIGEEEMDLMVVPMSLQLLLENAIKHNVVSRAKPLTVNVITLNGMLKVENKLQPKSTQLPSTKLGLKNIEKRYSLLSDKSIKIENDGDTFKVSLPLLVHAKSIENESTNH